MFRYPSVFRFIFIIALRPRSALFPYTTLFRSDHQKLAGLLLADAEHAQEHQRHHQGGDEEDGIDRRSEEHTSELQSRQYLVCRLLLEKKKNSPRSSATWRGTSSTISCSDHRYL